MCRRLTRVTKLASCLKVPISNNLLMQEEYNVIERYHPKRCAHVEFHNEQITISGKIATAVGHLPEISRFSAYSVGYEPRPLINRQIIGTNISMVTTALRRK